MAVFLDCSLQPFYGVIMKSFDEITEAAKHKHYVELLADETNHSIAEVEPVYEDVYTNLKETAQIKDFVPVFAWRRTRALLMLQ